MFTAKPTEKKPEEVFTPRSSEVNDDMYVKRPGLEAALLHGLRSNPHLLLYGDSGTGKSWLYKKTFSDRGLRFTVANLANAARLGSIAAELKNLVDRTGAAVKVGVEETKKAEVSAYVAKGALEHKAVYDFGKMEPFEAVLAQLNAEAGGLQSVLVLDNLESAFTPMLLDELANLIILCDDERYSAYKVKILIVGVPSGVKQYYYKTPNHQTVANRLTELPEVSRLTRQECQHFVSRGFVDKLDYKVDDLTALQTHVAWITTGVPQMMHEYCLQVAFAGESRREAGSAELELADKKWTQDSMQHAYSVIEQHMNERDTKAGRRNQTIFALAVCESDQIKANEIESIVRAQFPTSTAGVALNIPQVLSQLEVGNPGLLRRTPKGDAYQFSDPRFRMVMRAMLRRTTDERVEKVSSPS